jgi:hypothetical protein
VTVRVPLHGMPAAMLMTVVAGSPEPPELGGVASRTGTPLLRTGGPGIRARGKVVILLGAD